MIRFIACMVLLVVACDRQSPSTSTADIPSGDQPAPAASLAPPSVDPPKPDPLLRRKWIDGLASKNTPPKLTKKQTIDVPVFPADYDWSDQERVQEAFFEVTHCRDAGFWDELLEHAKDDRYAFTARLHGPSASHFTVGQLCVMLAQAQLAWPTRLRSDPESRGPADVILEIGLDNLLAWRSERRDKSLLDLQVEVCETSAAKVSERTDLSREQKVFLITKLQEYRDDLLRTRVPRSIPFTAETFDWFGPPTESP